MITWGRHSERAVAAATAVLLQVAVYLALTERQAAPPHTASAPTIIAMILAAARPKREPPSARRPLEVQKLGRIVPRPVIRDIPTPHTHTSRSLFDWQGAIRGEVRQELAHAAAPPRMRFELPKMPAQQGPAREWEGWDDTRINRVQRLAHGIIDLGHGCYILLFPPIPQCHSEAADGHLFDHLRDRGDEVPGALP